jgi:hypothetical protein
LTIIIYYQHETLDLIERAQFALNAKIYRPGEFEELEKLGFEGSWLQWFLFEIECFHGECSFCSYVGLLVNEGRQVRWDG